MKSQGRGLWCIADNNTCFYWLAICHLTKSHVTKDACNHSLLLWVDVAVETMWHLRCVFAWISTQHFSHLVFKFFWINKLKSHNVLNIFLQFKKKIFINIICKNVTSSRAAVACFSDNKSTNQFIHFETIWSILVPVD